MTPKEQAENNRRLDPSELEKVTDVYGETAYIPKERKPDRLIPMYQKNGLRVVEHRQKDNIKWWSGVYLHPDNILTPNTCPKCKKFTAQFHADWTVATRPNGTQCQSRFTWESCACGYQSAPKTATLDFWEQEEREGRATLTETARALLLPEIVKRALSQTVADIGQLSQNEKKILNAYVKQGVISKGKGGGFPNVKTVYAFPNFDFVTDRERQVKNTLMIAAMMDGRKKASG